MRTRPLLLALVSASALALPTLASTASAAPPASTPGDARVCAHAPAGFAACDAHVRTKGGVPDASSSYSSGYSPAQLATAYGLGSLTGSTTIAIVDAYANPNAAADLAFYRKQFGLSPANLTQVSQSGGLIGTVAGDTGWGQEEMLDLDMVSAICPACPILYVGANSASFADLGAAVNTAAKTATVISNSYGGSESSSELSVQSTYYTHPGIAITVSSGDSGYGAQSPAAFNTVTAVGGTSLTLNPDGSRKSETVWSGAGSGCSAYVAKPTWQTDTRCAKRTIADVAAVADPATGVAVYDSYGSTGGNWYVFGGTSVAAPIIGGIYGLTGASTAGTPAALLYASPGSLFDVTSGTNTRRCRAGYLCTGGTGYDGPTGNGTPNGSLSPF